MSAVTAHGDRPGRPPARVSGWEPLALGVTGLFLGLVAVGASALNSRTTAQRSLTGPVWQVLTALGVLAGVAAVASWALCARRLGPGPLVGAVVGLTAAVGTPVEAVAVRPHPTRVRVYAIDGATGRRLWSAQPALTDVSAGFSIGADGNLVARGGDATVRCSARSVEVHLSSRTGRSVGRPVQVGVGPSSPTASVVDGDARFELSSGPNGNVVDATIGGVKRWSAAIPPGPPAQLSAGSGILLVTDALAGFRQALAAPMPGAVPTKGGDVRAYDAATGDVLWSDSAEGAIGATVSAGAVWTLGSDGTLASRDPRTGAKVSSATVQFQPVSGLAPGAGGLWSVNGTLVSLANGNELVGIDTHGATLWHVSLNGADQSPEAVTTTGGELVVAFYGRTASSCGGE